MCAVGVQKPEGPGWWVEVTSKIPPLDSLTEVRKKKEREKVIRHAAGWLFWLAICEGDQR